MLDHLHAPDPTLDQMVSVIDQLHKGGTLSVRLLGGEPLMRKDIGEIIRAIKYRGMFCEVVTNGVLLRRKIAKIPN